jgi:hypothetical protein
MGFAGGKFLVSWLTWRKNSCHSECPPAGSSARTHHQHAIRERRFHVPRQALGLGYDRYDVTAPLLPIPSSPPPPATEPQATESEAEALYDTDVVQQLAQSGIPRHLRLNRRWQDRLQEYLLIGVVTCVFLIAVLWFVGVRLGTESDSERFERNIRENHQPYSSEPGHQGWGR